MSPRNSHAILTLSLIILLASTSLVGCGVRNQAQFRNKIQTVNGVETVVPGDSLSAANIAVLTGQEGSGSKTLSIPSDKFGPMDPTLKKEETPAAAEPTASAPATTASASTPTAPATPVEAKTCNAKECEFLAITIDAAPEDHLKMNTKPNNKKMIVSLGAVVKVQKSVPAVEGAALNLLSAKDVTIKGFDQTGCRLLATSFNLNSDGSIRFTLMGMDDNGSTSPNNCLVKLSELSMTGFQAELHHVQVGGMFSELYVPRVHVNVAPHSIDVSR